jgi:hypothetical protein
MTTEAVPADGGRLAHQAPGAGAERPVVRAAGLVPLLFALNFAIALPPDAIIPPPDVAWPRVHPRCHAIVSAIDLAAALERPTRSVGCGRIMLADVDQRLRGLTVSLEVFRVIDGGGALVGVGVVTADRAANGGTTVADLWKLARQVLVNQAVDCFPPDGGGDDTFLAEYGSTVQGAWLAGDILVTAGVTGPDGERAWRIQAARSIALIVRDHLTPPPGAANITRRWYRGRQRSFEVESGAS